MAACNHCGDFRSQPVFTAKGYHLVECSGCGLAYIANPPDAEELSRIYSAQSNYHTELFDPASREFGLIARNARAHLDFVRRAARGGRVLDVGCSAGHFLDLARAEGFDSHGVEFSPDSQAFARKHFGLPVEAGSIHDVAHAPRSLDIVTMFDVIEHVPDPAADIAAAWRLLRPGGWFVLSTPNIDGLFPRLSRKCAAMLDYWPHPEPPHHLYQFSVRTLRAMLEKAGFEPGPVAHRHIGLAYTFGQPRDLVRMPKRLAYALAFAPIARLGPIVNSGDWFYIAARKPA